MAGTGDRTAGDATVVTTSPARPTTEAPAASRLGRRRDATPTDMTLFHTHELRHPTARGLLAAWLELKERKVGILPTIAEQLAPTSAGAINSGTDLAANLLEHHRARGAMHAAQHLAEESWWWKVWNDGSSPYVVIRPPRTCTDRAVRLLDEIDPRGFPGCRPDDIRRNAEARIVCETIACEAWLCLRTEMTVIDHVEVNRWAVEAGHRGKHAGGLVLYDADIAMVSWTYEPEDIQRWTQAGLLACWPEDDDAPAGDVLRNTRRHVRAMALSGTFPAAGQRLLNLLDTHPDPIGLVEETRRRLPSPTVEAERRHPGRHAAPPDPPRPPEPQPTPDPRTRQSRLDEDNDE